jgi:hypothetical protein
MQRFVWLYIRPSSFVLYKADIALIPNQGILLLKLNKGSNLRCSVNRNEGFLKELDEPYFPLFAVGSVCVFVDHVLLFLIDGG